MLVSVRDDSLSRLDVFKARLPDVLGNYLRLDRLSRDAGREAIVKPVESWGAMTNGGGPVEVEPGLVEAVLDEVGAGQIDAGLGGRGGADDLAGAGIETPYLQLVMQRVWDEERTAGSRSLRQETFERLGGARRIVADHLETAIEALSGRERDVAADLFHHLVTPSGTKVAHGVADLATYAGVPAEELDRSSSASRTGASSEPSRETSGASPNTRSSTTSSPARCWGGGTVTKRIGSSSGSA